MSQDTNTLAKPKYLTPSLISVREDLLCLNDDEMDTVLAQIESAVAKNLMAYNEDFWTGFNLRTNQYDANVYDASDYHDVQAPMFAIDIYPVDEATQCTDTTECLTAFFVPSSVITSIIDNYKQF